MTPWSCSAASNCHGTGHVNVMNIVMAGTVMVVVLAAVMVLVLNLVEAVRT